MNTPSADALRLAVKLSGHEGTQCKYGARICEGCIADAQTIERELKLRECDSLKAAAFTVVTEWDRREMETPMRFAEAISSLREALKAI